MRAGAARLDKMLNQKQQGRLDGFFKVTPKDKLATGSAKDMKKTTGKRKVSFVRDDVMHANDRWLSFKGR